MNSLIGCKMMKLMDLMMKMNQNFLIEMSIQIVERVFELINLIYNGSIEKSNDNRREESG